MPVRSGAFLALFLITAACSAALSTAPLRADQGALKWFVQAVSTATLTGYGIEHVTIGIMDTISMPVDAVGLREGLQLMSRPLEQAFRITWQDVVTADAAVSLLKSQPVFLVLYEVLNLADDVRSGIRAFRLSCAGSVPLKADIDADPAPVLGEALELELLVLNLIKNAAEAVSDMKDRQGRAIGRGSVRLSADN